MGSFKSVFDPLDLEIMDRVYEVAWAHAQAREPSRNTASDGARQKALRRKIFGVARIAGPGHIDFDTLTEVVLATISEQPEPEPSPRVGQRDGVGVRARWQLSHFGLVAHLKLAPDFTGPLFRLRPVTRPVQSIAGLSGLKGFCKRICKRTTRHGTLSTVTR